MLIKEIQSYILLTPAKQILKDFAHLRKKKKCSHSSIDPSATVNFESTHDGKDIANILSEFFPSVFTEEYLSDRLPEAQDILTTRP